MRETASPPAPKLGKLGALALLADAAGLQGWLVCLAAEELTLTRPTHFFGGIS